MCGQEQLYGALQTLELMEEQGVPLLKDNIYHLLQGCTKQRNFMVARRAHSLMVSSELDSLSFLGDHLIRLFASCGSLLEANQVFCKVSNPSVFTWNGIISAHVRAGECERAVELYREMQDDGVKADNVLFLSILKACGMAQDIGQGRLIHDQVISYGFESEVFVGSTIIDMYAKCGSLEEARQVFDKLVNRNVVSWNVMIAGYGQNGLGLPALELFEKMQVEGVKVDGFMFSCILKACGHTKDIGLGRRLHDQIKEDGFESELVVGNALVDMYCKCAGLKEACEVFDKMPNRNVISWTVMIAGYAQHGHGSLALELHEKMLQKGLMPERATFLCVLKACSSIGAVESGRSVHGQIIHIGLDLDVAIANTLVDMYAKCGSLDEAHKVFDKVCNRNVVSWGAMIAGHSQHGHSAYALDLFMRMQHDGIKPDDVMLSSLLKACGNIEAIQQGRLLHDQILRSSLQLDLVIGNGLIDMYAKCGSVEEAQKVFESIPNRNLISWGSIIAGFTQQGHALNALTLLEKMQEEGFVPDKAVLLCALQACGNIGSIEKGQVLHEQIIDIGFKNDLAIGNALVDMFAKCGLLEEALNVFNDLPVRDVTSWGTIITGHAHDRSGLAVLGLFERMQQEGTKPNDIIIPCILKACSGIGSIRLGHLTHDQVIRGQLESITVIENSLIDMYAKCRSIEEAQAVFDRMQSKDQVSWSVLIAGYAHGGNCRMILHCLEGMKQQGLKPSGVLFVSILGACSQAGLLEEGRRFFKSMTENFCIRPAVEHYNCMIDLLGRAGRLLEAVKFIETMPISLDLVGWMSLLSNCRVYGDVQVGRFCLEQVMQLDPRNASGLMLMINIYANAGMWEDANKLQEMQRSAGMPKKPGMAWIEVRNKVHEFMVGEEQLGSDQVYCIIDKLGKMLKEEGYVPEVDLMTEPVSSKVGAFLCVESGCGSAKI